MNNEKYSETLKLCVNLSTFLLIDKYYPFFTINLFKNCQTIKMNKFSINTIKINIWEINIYFREVLTNIKNMK
jgi:hypothetical protein